MDLLSRFFLFDTPTDALLLDSRHDPGLVALSVLVAVITSYIALSLAERVREAPTRQLRLGALAAGALSLGGGVWTMHFIGMLAFQICGEVSYDPWWTVGSMLPSLAAAWVALHGVTRREVTATQRVLSGTWMGSGIGLMHYGGMAAMQSSAQLRYDPAWFLASIVVAVALSTLALWLQHRLKRHPRLGRRLRILLAAGILGGAISGMHYTAMGAARFLGQATAVLDLQANMPVALALAVALIALVVSVTAVGVNAVLVQRQLLRDRVRSEARLQALVDTAVDGVVRLDEHGCVVAVNHAAEQIFGAAEASLRGQALRQLVPALAARPADFAGVVEGRIERPGQGAVLLRLAIGHSGGSGTPGDADGERQSVAFVTDITEARSRQAELEGLHAAIDRAMVVVEFDLDGRVLNANDAFLALVGHSRESLIGQPHHLLCPPEVAHSPAHADLWTALQRGESRTGDFERLRRDGRPIWIRATYNPLLDASGAPLRIVKFVSDLTERYAMEQELRQAMARAEQAAAAKSTFLANMSHEIRTPMNAIIGFSEVTLEGPLSPEARDHLQVIHRSAKSLLGLLNDILDTAKLDHGALELEQRDFSLQQLCSDVLATQQVNAGRKGLVLSLQFDPALPPYHRGDPLRLQQVLMNLVGNAVKFTEHGQVRIEAGPHPDGGLEVAVVDTGIGIAADRIERIFDPFAQADTTMARRFGGTGLGTTIARQLVRLMGGEIGVHSQPGQGSRFWFRLTLPQGQAPQALPAAATLLQLPPLRILAADDLPENLRLLEIRLQALGHRVSTATDGQAALDSLQGNAFDLALLDVQMPGMDGLQACQRWREHEAAHGLPRLPVIALTASVAEEDRALTEAAGMDGFACKPIDWPQLLAEMARVLGSPALAVGPARAPAGDAAETPATDQASPPEGQAVSPAGPAARANHPLAASSTATGLLAPRLPEAVDWPQALSRWGDAGLWQQHLQRFLDQALAGPLPASEPAAQAHRLRGACANFGLTGLAQALAPLEEDAAAPAADWAALRARLQAVRQALPQAWPQAEPGATEADTTAANAAVPVATIAAATPPTTRPPWPAAAAAALGRALDRGELPDGPYRDVLQALPGQQRERLRDAADGFAFDEARALLDTFAQELA